MVEEGTQCDFSPRVALTDNAAQSTWTQPQHVFERPPLSDACVQCHVTQAECSVQADMNLPPRPPQSRNSRSLEFREGTTSPPNPRASPYSRASPEYGNPYYGNMSPRNQRRSYTSCSSRAESAMSIAESLVEGPVSTHASTPDIDLDVVLTQEDMLPQITTTPHNAGMGPVGASAQRSRPPRLNSMDEDTQNTAALIIQKAFRAKSARRAAHVAHRLRRKAARRAGAEARKAVSPETMGADYLLLGVGRNLKWAFNDRGATVSSYKGGPFGPLELGDHLIAVNDVYMADMRKEEIKQIWKREHGASEFTTLYFRRNNRGHQQAQHQG